MRQLEKLAVPIAGFAFLVVLLYGILGVRQVWQLAILALVVFTAAILVWHNKVATLPKVPTGRTPKRHRQAFWLALALIAIFVISLLSFWAAGLLLNSYDWSGFG